MLTETITPAQARVCTWAHTHTYISQANSNLLRYEEVNTLVHGFDEHIKKFV